MDDFDAAYADAVDALPNANVQHLIGKVREAPYRDVVLDFFQTGERRQFHFDEPHVNFLYLNGVIDREPAADGRQYVRFSCPFVQRRLFNYFSSTLAGYAGSVFTGSRTCPTRSPTTGSTSGGFCGASSGTCGRTASGC